MSDSISRKAALDEVHEAIYEFFDFCDDDEESPMTYKDKQLLELNKAITIRIKQLPSARPKGKWIEGEIVPDKESVPVWQQAQCSVCGKWHITPYLDSFNYHSFCPFCGAEMEVE